MNLQTVVNLVALYTYIVYKKWQKQGYTKLKNTPFHFQVWQWTNNENTSYWIVNTYDKLHSVINITLVQY